LPHIKGKWGGKPLQLEPWQKFILTTVFGWVKKDSGLRRFRICYTEVSRKNAKSTLSSGVALYMLLADSEPGAEVYSAATTRDQAKIVFGDAQAMVRKTPELREHYKVQANAHNINVLGTSSKFEALSADAHTLDGLNIHCAIIDELHAHKTRDVWDVVETATGARSQPIIWAITTAGSNRSGICYEQRTYLTKVLECVALDETYFGVVYTIDDGDDWTQEQTWEKANPNYGVSIYPDDLARLVAKAMQMASAVNNLLTKRFCVWVSADTAWMDMRAWDRCKDESLDIEDFTDAPCWIALDLATKTDIAAMALLFKRGDDYYAFGRYYVPQETVENASNSQYSGWERTGKLTATTGAVTDFAAVENDVLELCARFKVQEIAKDPWQSAYLGTRMQDQGLTVVDVRQTVQMMSAPMKELESLVLSGRFHHDGDPVLAWMASNVVAHLDNKENIYPKKERPENKIDGIIALIMGLNRALVSDSENRPSVYESRGLLTA
jgi:phage terminase large subunit-like protein